MEKKAAIVENAKEVFNFSHSISDDWKMPKYHIHDSYEILFSLTDGVKFFIEDNIYNVNRGDIFIVNNKELHRTVPKENAMYNRYIIMFKPEFIEQYSSQVTDLLRMFLEKKEQGISHRVNILNYGGEKALKDFEILLNKVEYYSNSTLYGSEIRTKIAFAELLLYIDVLYYKENSNSHKSINFIKNKDKVHDIIQYINNHFAEELSLDKVSSIFFMNKYYLSHYFKENTGFTLNEYIVHKRIMKARELLLSGQNVSQVTELVGFKNYCHFIRVFKNKTGISPKQYQKNN